MGRTLLPHSLQVDFLEERFKKYRRALRRDDQEIFDRIFRAARSQLQSGVLAASPNPADSVLLAALIEQGRRLRQLETRLEELEEDLRAAVRSGS